jgi:L-asparaginase
MRARVLMIYTGGTIGMTEDPRTKALIPLNFNQLSQHVPELALMDLELSVQAFDKPIDSSDVDVSTWVKLTGIIRDAYNDYDGFVVLHGTDTMAYTASALSFMLENLNKPVIITGSQLPIGRLRTDGKENLISALEVKDSRNKLGEVLVYFGAHLFRGNRTHKYNTEDFEAIESANLPPLASVGTHIIFNRHLMLEPSSEPFIVHQEMERNVGVLKLFPGISQAFVERLLSTPGLKGLILETYGAGNAPSEPWLSCVLAEKVKMGMVIVNVTQCNKGFVEQGRYQTSVGLSEAGVISAADMTMEAALTKLMYLLAKGFSLEEVKRYYVESLRGELTSYSKLV